MFVSPKQRLTGVPVAGGRFHLPCLLEQLLPTLHSAPSIISASAVPFLARGRVRLRLGDACQAEGQRIGAMTAPAAGTGRGRRGTPGLRGYVARPAAAAPATPRAGGALLSASSGAIVVAALLLIFVLLNPNCRSLPFGISSLSSSAATNATELRRLTLEMEALRAQLHEQAGANARARAGEEPAKAEVQCQGVNARLAADASSRTETLFTAASTAYKYHLQQREASFARDKVRPEEPTRWTEAKLREIFLVPVYSCPTEIRVGEWGEGGKWLCNIFPFRADFRRHAGGRGAPALASGKETTGYKRRLDPARPLVVYSVGSRDETSFEEAVRRLLGVRPHTMDPSLSADKQEHLRSLPYIHFHNLGLTGKDKKRGHRAWGPLMRFTEVMAMLNHSYVDVLKIDCEGCEVDVMQDLFDLFGRVPPVGQVLMEIHHVSIPKVQLGLLLLMEKLGFRMYHSENNERYLKAHEVAYIHEGVVDPVLWPPITASMRRL